MPRLTAASSQLTMLSMDSDDTIDQVEHAGDDLAPGTWVQITGIVAHEGQQGVVQPREPGDAEGVPFVVSGRPVPPGSGRFHRVRLAIGAESPGLRGPTYLFARGNLVPLFTVAAPEPSGGTLTFTEVRGGRARSVGELEVRPGEGLHDVAERAAALLNERIGEPWPTDLKSEPSYKLGPEAVAVSDEQRAAPARAVHPPLTAPVHDGMENQLENQLATASPAELQQQIDMIGTASFARHPWIAPLDVPPGHELACCIGCSKPGQLARTADSPPWWLCSDCERVLEAAGRRRLHASGGAIAGAPGALRYIVPQRVPGESDPAFRDRVRMYRSDPHPGAALEARAPEPELIAHAQGLMTLPGCRCSRCSPSGVVVLGGGTAITTREQAREMFGSGSGLGEDCPLPMYLFPPRAGDIGDPLERLLACIESAPIGRKLPPGSDGNAVAHWVAELRELGRQAKADPGEYTPREMRLMAERDAALTRAETAESAKVGGRTARSVAWFSFSACPFCGRTDLLDVEAVAERGFLAVKCRACGAVGPGGRTSPYDGHGKIDRVSCHEATALWNSRREPPRSRPPRTGYRDEAGVYHPAPDTPQYAAHRDGCEACQRTDR